MLWFDLPNIINFSGTEKRSSRTQFTNPVPTSFDHFRSLSSSPSPPPPLSCPIQREFRTVFIFDSKPRVYRKILYLSQHCYYDICTYALICCLYAVIIWCLCIILRAYPFVRLFILPRSMRSGHVIDDVELCRLIIIIDVTIL